MRNTFHKTERLHKKLEIEQIFREGEAFVEYPFKVIYKHQSLDKIPLKFAISIPKKKHPLAVDRNLLKRRIREAYRKNNHKLKENLLLKNKSIHIFLIFLSSEKLPYQHLEDKIILLLQRLEKN